MLDYDEKIAKELDDDSLFELIYSECLICEKEFNTYPGPGPYGAFVMDIMSIVKKYSKDYPQIDVRLWTGIILKKMHPEKNRTK
jgi:hypothetical protein